MQGYWNDPEATAERLRPGRWPWERVLATGDLFRADEEGFLYFVGRRDDIIKSRGEKVAPREVEAVLHAAPGVRSAAVVGAPDGLLGEAVVAYVVPRDGRGAAAGRAAPALRRAAGGLHGAGARGAARRAADDAERESRPPCAGCRGGKRRGEAMIARLPAGRRPVRAALALATLLAVLLAAGCGGESAQQKAARAAAAEHAHTMRLGARVFAENCATCHPLLGRPNVDFHPDAPPLDLDQVRFRRAYATQMVQNGRVAMPGMGQLGEAKIEAVVDYVMAVGGRETYPPAHLRAAELQQGRALYDAHCLGCHAILGRGGDRPNPIWQAPAFEDVRPGVLYTESKIREGQGEAMPAFPRLEIGQLRAIAVYANAMAMRKPVRAR